MLNKVQIDLLKKHVGPFLLCFFVMMFILLMNFLIQYVDQLVGKGLPAGIVIELILTNLAYMVVLAIPISVLVSTLIAFGKFSEWNELTAIRAAGINPIRLMIPVIISGGLLFVFTAYFSNYILPDANHKARSLFLDIRMQNPAFDLQPGIFYGGLDGYTFLIREMDTDSDSLYDVRVFQEQSDNRYRAYISAERGRLETPDEYTLTLFLYEGSVLRYIPGERRDEETLERSRFEKYRMSFDLSEMAFSRSNPDQRSRTDRTMSAQAMLAVIDTLREEKRREINKFKENTGQHIGAPLYTEQSIAMQYMADGQADDTLSIVPSQFEILNLLPNPSAQTASLNNAMNSLDRYRSELENLQTNLRWRQFRVAEFMVEVHKKVSIPFACLIFVFLGAPIGMLTRKGNIGFAALVATVLLTVYFTSVIQGEKLADRMIITPFMGMWGVNLLYMGIGLLLTIHISTSLKISNLWRRRE